MPPNERSPARPFLSTCIKPARDPAPRFPSRPINDLLAQISSARHFHNDRLVRKLELRLDEALARYHELERLRTGKPLPWLKKNRPGPKS